MVSSLKGFCSSVMKDIEILVTGATAGLISSSGAYVAVAQIDPSANIITVGLVAAAGITTAARTSIALDRRINKAEPVSNPIDQVIIRMIAVSATAFTTVKLFNVVDDAFNYIPGSNVAVMIRIWTSFAVASVSAILLFNKRAKKVAVETPKAAAIETKKTRNQRKAPTKSVISSKSRSILGEQTKKNAEVAVVNIRKIKVR